MNCETCRWFDDSDPGSIGRCRKNPPVIFGRPDEEYMSDWPEVDPEVWCGQWQEVIDNVTPSTNIVDAWQKLCNIDLPGRKASDRRKGR